MPQSPPDPPGARLAAELAGLDYALPGTLATRYMRCGKPNCRCKADPPTLHGLSLIHISEPTRPY